MSQKAHASIVDVLVLMCDGILCSSRLQSSSVAPKESYAYDDQVEVCDESSEGRSDVPVPDSSPERGDHAFDDSATMGVLEPEPESPSGHVHFMTSARSDARSMQAAAAGNAEGLSVC